MSHPPPVRVARRVRVARVIARMNVGGPAQQILRLSEGLDPARYDHALFCGEVEEGEADFIDLRAPGLPHQRIAGLRRSVGPTKDLVALTSLVNAFRTFRPHIVHTHTVKAGILGRVAAEIAGVPVRVHTFHGHLLNGYWSPQLTAGVIATERALARRTDRIMAVGDRVRADLLAAGIGRPDQYQVVPPGVAVPPPPPAAAARASLGLAPHGLVLAFVGRLAQVKRPDRLLEVVRHVAAQIPDVTLLVVGEGPLYARTIEAARDLGDTVRFLGWRADVERIYAAADIVVLTSDNEGMPVGLIEASMCSRPCVTTDVGSAGEVVLDGRTGRVTSTDPHDLARAVLNLAMDAGQRGSYGEAGRRHAQRKFGASRLIADVDAAYRELLRGSRLLRGTRG